MGKDSIETTVSANPTAEAALAICTEQHIPNTPKNIQVISELIRLGITQIYHDNIEHLSSIYATLNEYNCLEALKDLADSLDKNILQRANISQLTARILKLSNKKSLNSKFKSMFANGASSATPTVINIIKTLPNYSQCITELVAKPDAEIEQHLEFLCQLNPQNLKIFLAYWNTHPGILSNNNLCSIVLATPAATKLLSIKDVSVETISQALAHLPPNINLEEFCDWLLAHPTALDLVPNIAATWGECDYHFGNLPTMFWEQLNKYSKTHHSIKIDDNMVRGFIQADMTKPSEAARYEFYFQHLCVASNTPDENSATAEFFRKENYVMLQRLAKLRPHNLLVLLKLFTATQLQKYHQHPLLIEFFSQVSTADEQQLLIKNNIPTATEAITTLTLQLDAYKTKARFRLPKDRKRIIDSLQAAIENGDSHAIMGTILNIHATIPANSDLLSICNQFISNYTLFWGTELDQHLPTSLHNQVEALPVSSANKLNVRQHKLAQIFNSKPSGQSPTMAVLLLTLFEPIYSWLTPTIRGHFFRLAPYAFCAAQQLRNESNKAFHPVQVQPGQIIYNYNTWTKIVSVKDELVKFQNPSPIITTANNSTNDTILAHTDTELDLTGSEPFTQHSSFFANTSPKIDPITIAGENTNSAPNLKPVITTVAATTFTASSAAILQPTSQTSNSTSASISPLLFSKYKPFNNPLMQFFAPKSELEQVEPLDPNLWVTSDLVNNDPLGKKYHYPKADCLDAQAILRGLLNTIEESKDKLLTYKKGEQPNINSQNKFEVAIYPDDSSNVAEDGLIQFLQDLQKVKVSKPCVYLAPGNPNRGHWVTLLILRCEKSLDILIIDPLYGAEPDNAKDISLAGIREIADKAGIKAENVTTVPDVTQQLCSNRCGYAVERTIKAIASNVHTPTSIIDVENGKLVVSIPNLNAAGLNINVAIQNNTPYFNIADLEKIQANFERCEQLLWNDALVPNLISYNDSAQLTSLIEINAAGHVVFELPPPDQEIDATTCKPKDGSEVRANHWQLSGLLHIQRETLIATYQPAIRELLTPRRVALKTNANFQAKLGQKLNQDFNNRGFSILNKLLADPNTDIFNEAIEAEITTEITAAINSAAINNHIERNYPHLIHKGLFDFTGSSIQPRSLKKEILADLIPKEKSNFATSLNRDFVVNYIQTWVYQQFDKQIPATINSPVELFEFCIASLRSKYLQQPAKTSIGATQEISKALLSEAYTGMENELEKALANARRLRSNHNNHISANNISAPQQVSIAQPLLAATIDLEQAFTPSFDQPQTLVNNIETAVALAKNFGESLKPQSRLLRHIPTPPVGIYKFQVSLQSKLENLRQRIYDQDSAENPYLQQELLDLLTAGVNSVNRDYYRFKLMLAELTLELMPVSAAVVALKKATRTEIELSQPPTEGRLQWDWDDWWFKPDGPDYQKYSDYQGKKLTDVEYQRLVSNIFEQIQSLTQKQVQATVNFQPTFI